MSNLINTDLSEYWDYCFLTAWSYAGTPIPQSLIPFISNDFLTLYLALKELRAVNQLDIDYFGFIPLTNPQILLIAVIAQTKNVDITYHNRLLTYPP